MGAVSLFLVLPPEKDPFSPWFCFLCLSRICRVFSPKSGFSSKNGPFFLPIGRGCCAMSKNSPLMQPRDCNASKTRHHRQIAHALCLCRLFHVTLVSPLMSSDHDGSEIGIISPARASATTWAPISCRSLPGGRDFSSNNLIFGLIYSAYTELPMFSYHILSPTVQNNPLSTTVWNACPRPQ